MKAQLFIFSCLAWLCQVVSVVALPADNSQVADTGIEYKSIVYFTDWSIYGQHYNPADLPVDKLTHVMYAFADIRSDGEVFLTDTWADTDIHFNGDSWSETGKNLYGCAKQIFLLKQKNRELKTLLSIGGWSYRSHFGAPVSTPEGRKRFAESSVKLMGDLGMDGVDVDWEYPENDNEATDMILLLREIRAEMTKYSMTHTHNAPYFLLTIAAPAGPTHYNVLHLAELGQTLDFINLMGYDYAGSWDKTSGHAANLYVDQSNTESTKFSTEEAISSYIKAGVPSEKLVLGMPIYGKSFANTDGLGKAYNGQGAGSKEGGVWDYKDLPRPGAKVTEVPSLGAAYSYDSSTHELVSFDTVETIKTKAEYIKSRRLGGGMFWEASQDKKGQESLITTLFEALGGRSHMEHMCNQIDYPDSVFENLKKGFR